MIEQAALRRKVNGMHAARQAAFHRAEAVNDRLACQHHPVAAAVGRIVHATVLIPRIIADVRAADANGPALLRAAEDTLRKEALEHRGKQGENFKIHKTAPPLL